MTDTELAELEKLATAATQGPWLYRPNEFDDWGWVRMEQIDADGFQPLIASCKAGHDVTDEEMNEHRRNRTDPFAANAQFIAAANPATVLSLISDIKRLREALKPFAEAYVDRGDWADESFIGGSALRNKHLRNARAALEETNG